MIHHYYLKHLSFFVLLFSVHFSLVFGQELKEPTPIHLEDVTINEETTIELNDHWEFYWNTFIKPGNFNNTEPFSIVSLKNWTEFKATKTANLPSFGYATYRLKIDIPKVRPHVSLYFPAAYSSSKIWINGRFFSEMGKVGTTKSATLHRRFSQIIPLNTDETHFEIVIQVANFYHNKGGIDKPLILGTSHHLHDLKAKRIMADMIFIGCLGFIGIFFLLFYVMYWNKDKAVLYFAILCISLSYMALSDRYAPFTVIFESISFILLTKFEYFTLFLAGTFGSLFFNNIFTNFIYKAYSKVILFSFSVLVLLIIFLNPPHFTKLLIPFLSLMIINLVYVTYVIIKAIIAKRLESILLLVSMVLGSIIFITHIFFFLGENGNAIIYVNFGYILVFLLLSMLLMKRFSDSFLELEKSKEIALLQKKEITAQSNQLVNANFELEESLKLLENYNAELDDFNHIVSHDLKTPLVSVHALVSFIEEDLKDTLNLETKEHLTLLKDVVARMDALINGLLNYSKIAKGNKQKEPFSFYQLLHKVKGVVDHQNLHIIELPAKDVEIYANKIELDHVFQNLLSNAIKHNDKAQTIIQISVIEKPNEYLFTVSDNGPGIDPKYHDKIFKMFSQLNVSNDVKSTGIGLAIVKKIVTENHGIITLDSEKDKGIRISFTWRIK
ncbi:MAG: ATP-binding protein [Polaribacter sp.]|nr:ATP-binding protein [Polaribacter sp.]